jgi:hypothetical protein
MARFFVNILLVDCVLKIERYKTIEIGVYAKFGCQLQTDLGFCCH